MNTNYTLPNCKEITVEQCTQLTVRQLCVQQFINTMIQCIKVSALALFTYLHKQCNGILNNSKIIIESKDRICFHNEQTRRHWKTTTMADPFQKHRSNNAYDCLWNETMLCIGIKKPFRHGKQRYVVKSGQSLKYNSIFQGNLGVGTVHCTAV